MRKQLLAFLLPVILLLSQQGAVLHEIGHLTDLAGRVDTHAGAPGPETGSHQASDLQCQACLAFAHLAGVATATVVPPALLSFSFQLPLIEAPAFIAADAPAARSRGPPASA